MPATDDAPPPVLTVQLHADYLKVGIDWRVLVDGEDVTTRCQYARAGRTGAALCVVRDADGFMIRDPVHTDEPLRELLRGYVVFVRAPRPVFD